MDDVAPGSRLLAPGAELHGRYKIIDIIGRGGMSAVYEAEHLGLGKRVAIKEMMAPAGLGPETDEAIRRFQNEARTLAKLEHRYFPDVTDFFSHENRYYLVMDYVDGETLEDLVKRTPGFLPEDVVLRWATQLCDVLSYLHAQNPPVVFRDLKPSNIMIDKEGQVKLIDFGIARFFKPGKASDTQSMGTAGYSAPEQYGTGQTDARSDIYSLGACLHFLLTRRDPTASPFTFPPVRESNPRVSATTEKVVARCVAMKPEDRFQTAVDVKKALTAPAKESETTYLNRPVRVATVPAPPPIVTASMPALPPRPPRSAAPIIALVIAILAVCGVIGYMIYNMEKAPAQVAVPNLVGMDREAAAAALQQTQLGMSFQGVEDSDRPADQVTRQDPTEGATLPVAQPVKVWFSRGHAVQVVPVPDVTRMLVDRAKDILAEKNLQLGAVTHDQSGAVPKDYIIRTIPPAGRTLEAGQPVDVVVSDGVPAPPPPVTPAPAPPTQPPTTPNEPDNPAGQPNFDVHVPVPSDGKKHQVQIVVRQSDGPHVVVNDLKDQDVKETISAPAPGAISATIDGQPVTPDIRPIVLGAGGNGGTVGTTETTGPQAPGSATTTSVTSTSGGNDAGDQSGNN